MAAVVAMGCKIPKNRDKRLSLENIPGFDYDYVIRLRNHITLKFYSHIYIIIEYCQHVFNMFSTSFQQAFAKSLTNC